MSKDNAMNKKINTPAPLTKNQNTYQLKRGFGVVNIPGERISKNEEE